MQELNKNKKRAKSSSSDEDEDDPHWNKSGTSPKKVKLERNISNSPKKTPTKHNKVSKTTWNSDRFFVIDFLKQENLRKCDLKTLLCGNFQFAELVVGLI